MIPGLGSVRSFGLKLKNTFGVWSILKGITDQSFSVKNGDIDDCFFLSANVINRLFFLIGDIMYILFVIPVMVYKGKHSLMEKSKN